MVFNFMLHNIMHIDTIIKEINSRKPFDNLSFKFYNSYKEIFLLNLGK